MRQMYGTRDLQGCVTITARTRMCPQRKELTMPTKINHDHTRKSTNNRKPEANTRPEWNVNVRGDV